MMDIGKEILFEKFLKPKLEKLQQITPFQMKKSGLFTGTRSVLTYNTNVPNHYANKANDYLYINNRAKNKINEAIEILENNLNNSSIRYRRNVKTEYGTKRSAVPHGIIQKVINKEAPPKPRDGRVPTMLNTKWGQQEIQKKYRNIARLFKNLRLSQNQ
jgi:hypothetical protein